MTIGRTWPIGYIGANFDEMMRISSWRFIRSTLGYACAILALFVSTESKSSSVCFSPQEKPNVTVLQQAPPPPTNGYENYFFYPASAVATMQIDKISSSRASVPMYFAQWANHGPRRVPKSNVGPGIFRGGETGVHFSSVDRADACTLAQTATVLGDDDGARAFAKGYVELRKDVSAGDFVDVCFVHSQTLHARAAGIFFDYEVGDGRTPEETAKFLVDYADYVHRHGKKVLLYADPLNAPSQRLTGISEKNLPRIVDAFDLVDIMLWGGNREHDIKASFENQKSMIRPWRPDKVFVVFELNRTTVEDAKVVSSLMKQNDIRVISFWRDLAKQGGSCDLPVNKKIACLALGRC